MKKLCLWLLLGLWLCLGSAAAEAGMISEKQEIAMGREYGKSLEMQYGVLPDAALQERVNRIGQSIAKVCGRPELQYSFKVLNCNEVNALACPGGFIYVFKGLTDYMPTDMELAGVLGHEVGHVVKKHTVHQIEKQMLTTLLTFVAARGEAFGLALVAQQALMAGYSRADERSADREGFTNALNAGYNPYSMLIAVYKLDDFSKEQGDPGYGLFASHPEPEARIKQAQKLLEKLDIHPDVYIEDDDHATVSEGGWSFEINRSIGNTKAKYRAYMLAGSLWTVRRRGPVNPAYFVVYDHGASAIIYYDDIQLLTVYTQDAGAYGSAGAYAAVCTERLRQWAQLANAAAAKKGK